jgi:ankyrin repeat protein
VTAQDQDGWTPLYVVSRGDYVELARLLVEHGADVAAQDSCGLTPLHLAKDVGFVQFLIDHGADAAA